MTLEDFRLLTDHITLQDIYGKYPGVLVNNITRDLLKEVFELAELQLESKEFMKRSEKRKPI